MIPAKLAGLAAVGALTMAPLSACTGPPPPLNCQFYDGSTNLHTNPTGIGVAHVINNVYACWDFAGHLQQWQPQTDVIPYGFMQNFECISKRPLTPTDEPQSEFWKFEYSGRFGFGSASFCGYTWNFLCLLQVPTPGYGWYGPMILGCMDDFGRAPRSGDPYLSQSS